MVTKNIDVAIMFADIAGSTMLYDTLGDHDARTKVVASLQVMTQIVKDNKGRVIKTIGDEIMSTFPSAENASMAAWDIQDKFEQIAIKNTDGVPVMVRIGMHFGPAILENDGDLHGDAVNIAARMAVQAKAKQIITTKNTLAKLTPAMQASSRFVDHAPIKGKKEVMEIYELIWQEEDITSMATGIIKKKALAASALRVTYNGKTIELNKDRPSLVMGRGQNCDFIINDQLASRQHVRIELRRDKFFIVDQSTNGTRVIMGQSAEQFLRREEASLTHSGRISLGSGFKNENQIVKFTLVE